MARRRRYMPPFELDITGLADKGLGTGIGPDGREVRVRKAPVGSRLLVQTQSRKKGVWSARRLSLIRPPADHQTPPCPQFELCGGCSLQEMSLAAQRGAKADRAVLDVLGTSQAPGVTVHGVRGAPEAYHYRNKVELSFGVKRYLSQPDQDAGLSHGGRFLGFKAPGRFDRVVDAPTCHLISEGAGELLRLTREAFLPDGGPPLWNVRDHTGFLRHLSLREGSHTGEWLVSLYTTSPADPSWEQAVEAWAQTLQGAELPGGRLMGICWFVNDGVADVARGELRKSWGQPWLTERLGDRLYRVSPHSFFQTSSDGAEVLYDTIGEAVGSGGTLLDLYCGAGTIGLYLSDRFDRIFGIEEIPSAVEDAGRNAEANGIEGAEFVCAKVEDVLEQLDRFEGQRTLVVDPPRVGLHPKVARKLADAQADVLVYVACKPGSLGRDREILEAGGWTLTDLWTVDLFPQTGHMEAVARFVRA